MSYNFYILWIMFNVCFIAFTIYILYRVIYMENKVKILENKMDSIHGKIGVSIDNSEEQYSSLCDHIQNNREIGLDIYAEVRKR